jgi:hypothetical protein
MFCSVLHCSELYETMFDTRGRRLCRTLHTYIKEVQSLPEANTGDLFDQSHGATASFETFIRNSGSLRRNNRNLLAESFALCRTSASTSKLRSYEWLIQNQNHIGKSAEENLKMDNYC